jgi:uncharacterized membrane protein SirB2
MAGLAARPVSVRARLAHRQVLGLVAYIALGTIALKRGRTKGERAAAFAGALLAVAWVVSVALTRDPLGFLR